MLELKLHRKEIFDEETERFFYTNETVLKLEHSLISVSKWEAKWKIPFLEAKERTPEQTIDYVRCMTLNTNVDESTYKWLTQKEIDEIAAYINDEMTATWFNNSAGRGKAGGKGQTVTSELIYYWMIAYNIPPEYQKWHLNRLLTLIRICEIKNQPPKKMKKDAIRSSNRSINEARKRALGTKG